MPTIKQVPITKVQPYWRNPRKNDNAVPKVAESIEKYGFQQPILVDPDMVIIAGHTRWAAARSLGLDKVPVVVTELTGEQANAYRIADNRTGEYANWDNDALLNELKTFTDPEYMDLFFPHIDLTTDFADTPPPITDEDVTKAQDAVTGGFQDASNERAAKQTLEMTCPHCYGTIELNRSDLDQSPWKDAEE